MARLAFSIIIPTYARPERLAACLRSLTQLNYPQNQFEVIVVDDGSPSPLDETLAPFATQLNLQLFAQSHAGPAAARNNGASQAKGNYLAFTDDDCAPEPDWLKALAVALATGHDPCVGGRTINALPENPYSTASQDLVDYLYSVFNADPADAQFFTSNNLAVPANSFRRLGGFDPGFPFAAGEDRDWCDRWRASGSPMIYTPKAVVHHSHALTLRAFWHQQFNYGRGAHRFRQKRAIRAKESARLERLSFYLRLVARPFARLNRRKGLAIAALTVLSQIANGAGYAREWLGARP